MQKQLLRKVLKRLDEAILCENPVIPKFDLEEHEKEEAYARLCDEVCSDIRDVAEEVGEICKEDFVNTIIDILENYDKHDICIEDYDWENKKYLLRVDDEYTQIEVDLRTGTLLSCHSYLCTLFPKETLSKYIRTIKDEIYKKCGYDVDEKIEQEDFEQQMFDDGICDAYISLNIKLSSRVERTAHFLFPKIWEAQGNKAS